jgi:hypothetical protein
VWGAFGSGGSGDECDRAVSLIKKGRASLVEMAMGTRSPIPRGEFLY